MSQLDQDQISMAVEPVEIQGTTDPRTYTFYNTATHKIDSVDVVEPTWGELKARMQTEYGIDFTNMMVSYMSDKTSLVSDSAVLKGTDEVVYVSPVEQKGGMKQQQIVSLNNAERKTFLKAVIKADPELKTVLRTKDKSYSKLNAAEILAVLKKNARKLKGHESLLPSTQAVATVPSSKKKKKGKVDTPAPIKADEAYIEFHNTLSKGAKSLNTIADIVDGSSAIMNKGFIQEANELLNVVIGSTIGYLVSEVNSALSDDERRARMADAQKELLDSYRTTAKALVDSIPSEYGVNMKKKTVRRSRW